MMSTKKKVLRMLNNMDFSTKHLAHYIVLPHNDLLDWLDGKKEMPFRYVVKVSEFLGCEPIDLLGD